MTQPRIRFISWSGLFLIGLIALVLSVAPGATEARSAQAPPGYIVFDRLPWDTGQQSSVRVSRTGRLYKAVYDGAGLTAYTNADYHPALDAMTAQQRGALDFAIPTGTRVLAVAGGKVVSRTTCQVGVRHANGMVAYYLHMSKVDVKLNATVSAGQQLGLSGATCGAGGAHLHFALWSGNKEVPVAFANVPAQTSNGKTCPASVICPSKTNYVEFRYGGSAPQPTPTSPPQPTPTRIPPIEPEGYTFCAWENERCTFSGTREVAYGVYNSLNHLYNLTGGVNCNNETFLGDPAPGIVKACFTKDDPPPPPDVFQNPTSTLNVTVEQVRLDVCADNLLGRTVYATLYRDAVNGYPRKTWNHVIYNAPERCITFVDMDGAGNTLAGVTYYTVASLTPISAADAEAKRTSCAVATGYRQLCDARKR